MNQPIEPIVVTTPPDHLEPSKPCASCEAYRKEIAELKDRMKVSG